MKESTHTLSDILHWIDIELFLCLYQGDVYILNRETLGDVDNFYGVVARIPLSVVERGGYDGDLFSSAPQLDAFIADTVEVLCSNMSNWKNIDENSLTTLFNSLPVSDWKIKIFDNYYIGDLDDASIYIEISEILNGTMSIKGETVTKFPSKYEAECIKSYLTDCEEE